MIKVDIPYYTSRFERAKEIFCAMPDLHPILADFVSIVQGIDINTYIKKVAEEISLNLEKYWVNSEYINSDSGMKLDALLFEYEALDRIGAKVFAYGIVDYKPEKLQFNEAVTLQDNDIASDFQSMPALTLSVTNDLFKINSQSLEAEYPDLEIYFERGWHELMQVYKNAIYLILSKAFASKELNEKMNSIDTNDPFYILIQEHDCSAQLIAKKVTKRKSGLCKKWF